MNKGIEYTYDESTLGCSHHYLLPKVMELVKGQSKLFELGCGNGAVANELHKIGVEICGVDTSESGIRVARKNFPHLNLEIGSAYDDLEDKYGKYPIVLSLEVVEHLFDPRLFAKNVFNLLDKNGTAIISTPFHGYWKNLSLALMGKMELHFSPLWDGGHIKFWSIRTITELLTEVGFSEIKVYRVGRIPTLAKSMIVVAKKNVIN